MKIKLTLTTFFSVFSITLALSLKTFESAVDTNIITNTDKSDIIKYLNLDITKQIDSAKNKEEIEEAQILKQKMKKSDIENFESYLDSYLNVLKKFHGPGKAKAKSHNHTNEDDSDKIQVNNTVKVYEHKNETKNKTKLKSKGKVKVEKKKVNSNYSLYDSKLVNISKAKNCTKRKINDTKTKTKKLKKEEIVNINITKILLGSNNSKVEEKPHAIDNIYNKTVNNSCNKTKANFNINKTLSSNKNISNSSSVLSNSTKAENSTINKDINQTNINFKEKIDNFLLGNIINTTVPEVPDYSYNYFDVEDENDDYSKNNNKTNATATSATATSYNSNNTNGTNLSQLLFTNITIKVTEAVATKNKTRNLMKARSTPLPKDVSNLPIDEHEIDKIYENLKKNTLNEEFERREKQTDRTEGDNRNKQGLDMKKKDTEVIENNIFKRIINISLALIVIGLLMGVFIGLIIVIYFNSKQKQ